ncbi:alpha/beta hydrolase [Dactylosporangium fulvum]|uniref:Alpha/beta hydrolase n=1 Tax=Dactylosporangium fulvum TaxID=53359 RepID=A0ABY5VXW2_9ACTN|nr:alpha/beta hydrolase [Dactylosporangium fulvum]UWP81691.1 alpha/beta hydrolase [Dactylosporangium fulvum]
MKLFHDTFGDGPPVALLHGGGSGRATWAGFVGALTGFRAVTPDLRGHGASPRAAGYPLSGYADDVIELLDDLGLDRVTLIGHSLGGFTASLVAQRQPDRVTRLVLEDPPAPPRHGTASGGFSRARLALAGVAGGLSLRRRFDKQALLSAITQLREPQPDWWEALPAISAPTLLLSGGPKSHIPPAGLAAVAEAVPDCRLVTVPVGHRIHSTAPVRFRETVLPFLRPDTSGGTDVSGEMR